MGERDISTARLFAALWALYVLVHQLKQIPWGPHYSLALMVFAVAMSGLAFAVLCKPGSTSLFLTLIAVQLAGVAAELPAMSNCWLFTGFLDVGILGAAVVAMRRGSGRCGLEDIYRISAPFLRCSLVAIYGFAVVAKLNSDFFDPDVSCATHLYRVMASTETYLPSSVSMERAAIPMALLGEASLPVLFLFRRTRTYAIVAGMLFHTLLAASPLVSVFDFNALLFALYVTMAPENFPKLLMQHRASRLAVRIARHRFVVFGILAVLSLLVVTLSLTSGNLVPLIVYRSKLWLILGLGMTVTTAAVLFTPGETLVPIVSPFRMRSAWLVPGLVPRSETHLVFFPAFDELGVAMPVAPHDVSQDRPAAVLMVRIVGVGKREIADAREDRFDPIQPRGVGRREHELHVVVGGPVGHLASLVGREVVEDEVEARWAWVGRANVLEEQQHFATSLASVAPHHESVVRDVVRREVLAGAMAAPVRGAQPRRVPDPAPRTAMVGAHFDGPEFVETDHAGVRRRGPVERTEAFFLAAKSGSGLSFQVFVRWNENPWSRRMRPSVVACSSLTTPHRTRWAASFRRDHTVNGRPRSCGRVPATSSMTLISSGAYLDGRPDAFRGRSTAKPPALNRRISSRTYSSWRYNRPAMARARIPCPEKATTWARRKYAAVFVVFKTRVSRRPSASVSSRTYRHT